MNPIQKTAKLGSSEITLETGKIAKQAHGAVMVRQGDSMVLVTVVSAPEKREGIDFFPLTVDYQEKLSAAGRVPGSYFRREGRATEKETLTSRIVDRSCRPLFAEGYANETQIIATVYSFDQEHDTDVLALTGASAALHLSDVPFNGPIAGVRVGRINGEFVANPTLAQRAEADLDVVMAASRDAIVMVEGGSKEVSEAVMVDALLFGQAAVKGLLDAQDALREAAGNKPRRAFDAPPSDAALKAKVKTLTWDKVKEAYGRHEKHDRYGRLSEIKKELLAQLREQAAGDAVALASLVAREKEIKGYYEDVEVRVHAQDDHGRGAPHRRSRPRRHPQDHLRGGAAAPRPRLGPLHARRDAGAGRHHPGDLRGRAAGRAAHRHDLQEVHAALQLPALLGR